jgi:hypothetical protein
MRCTAFSGHYGKCSFIDGDLIASEVILNAYEDSRLVITGDLKTKLFYGEDIWAEVGGTADFEYGEGYCLPIGWRDAARQLTQARRDTPVHRVLHPDVADESSPVRPLKTHEARARLSRGQSILR